MQAQITFLKQMFVFCSCFEANFRFFLFTDSLECLPDVRCRQQRFHLKRRAAAGLKKIGEQNFRKKRFPSMFHIFWAYFYLKNIYILKKVLADETVSGMAQTEGKSETELEEIFRDVLFFQATNLHWIWFYKIITVDTRVFHKFCAWIMFSSLFEFNKCQNINNNIFVF